MNRSKTVMRYRKTMSEAMYSAMVESIVELALIRFIRFEFQNMLAAIH